ncbi:MAG TPA: response regulator transcription factor [Thermoanaerobaculia bacterium]|jgi:DNA-binding NarL/FixJ family response regulator|nr:response regulator transcription factor [Thermoanaerobaculia bacterium]
MIRVALVEDQTIVRQGLKSLLALNADIEVAAEASDGEEAIAVIEREKPDVVLLDLRMPKKSGLEVLQALRERGTMRPTLILTTFDDDTMLFETIRAGAKGWMLKDVSLERLTSAIRTLAGGGTCIEPVITERIMRALSASNVAFESAQLPEPLTDREKTILRLLAGGYSNREISDLLNISDGTVKNHISSVLAKLGVRDRTRAVLKAIDLGFI